MNNHRKWTKEEVLEESKKYITRTVFARNSKGAFLAAYRNGWLKEMIWHVPCGRSWNRNTVFEESHKYTSRTEFARKAVGAYLVAKKNGWLDEMTWLPLKVRRKWTKEECIEESKKYNTRRDFQNFSSGAYTAALDNKWLDEMPWLALIYHQKWSKEDCLGESKKYESRSEFQHKSSGAYQAAMKNGWLDEMTWLKTPMLKEIKQVRKHIVYVYFDEENRACYVGRTNDIKRRDRDHRNLKGLYKNDSLKKYFDVLGKEIPSPVALKIHLLPEESQYWEDYYVNYYQQEGYTLINRAKTGINIGSLGGGFVKWTKESVLEESRKYMTFGEFCCRSASAYQAARKNGWDKEMTWLKYDQMPNGYWTKERVIEESKKYSSRAEFEEFSCAAYSAALKNGWSKDLPLTYKRVANGSYTKERIFEISHNYHFRTEFKLGCSRAYVLARKNGWLAEMTWLKPRYRVKSK